MYSSNFIVLFDANVLYPFHLRDLLIQLSGEDLFNAKWTNRINNEWSSNLLKNNSSISEQDIQKTIKKMNEAVLDCLIQNYEPFIKTLNLPDLDDHHVLAAAIKGQAQTIVTYNLKDFPSEILETFNIQAKHPDEFLMELLDLSEESVLRSFETVRLRLKNPSFSKEGLIEVYRQKHQLNKFCDWLETQ